MSEPDDDLTPLERIRRQAHRDIERVCDTWPHALQDALARGYGTGRTYDGTPSGTSELTSVEAAACKPDFATAWIAELGDILASLDWHPEGHDGQQWKTPETARPFMHGQIERIHHLTGRSKLYPVAQYNRITLRLHRLAEQAWYYWPDPPRQGQQVCGVTVGQRGNQVDVCQLCNEPAPAGRNPVTGKTLNVVDKDGRTLHRLCWYTLRLTPIKSEKQAC